MKSIFLSALGIMCTVFVFSACDKQKNTENVVTSENFVMYTDTTYPEISISENENSSAEEETINLSYAMNGNSVELSINGTVVKSIECYYTPPVEYIVVNDFNFDGYSDIFIPFEDPVTNGTYYCYTPEKHTFTENDELNSVGRIMVPEENGKLTEDLSDDNTKRFVEHEWTGNKLKSVRKTETYVSSESGNTITDVYTYDENGYEILSETIKGE